MAGNNDSLLNGNHDSYGGVTVEMKEHMDADVFAPLLRASISRWEQLGKKGVWIKLPTEHSHLVDICVKEGFWLYHAEPNYLMLVRRLPETTYSFSASASHELQVSGLVVNDKGEVLVVNASSGTASYMIEWKLPNGVVKEGEDISDAVVREVKEKTGVDTEFVKVLCFRQSHKADFGKSELVFLCKLKFKSEPSPIEQQDIEIKAARWMPMEEYAAQSFVFENEQFYYMTKICSAGAVNDYPGFGPLATTTGSGKRTYIYCYDPEYLENYASFL